MGVTILKTRKPITGERQQLLNIQEDHFNDVKSLRIKPSKLQKSFVAFANADGGDLYVGIEDKKVTGERLIGFGSVEEANEIIEVLLHQTKPSVENVNIEFIDFGHNGYVLHVSIPKSPLVHYTADGTCYIRINANSKKIIGEQITRLGYVKGQYSYEDTIAENADIDDIINGEYLSGYLERIGTSLNPERFLSKQGMIAKNDSDEYVVKTSCVLLFDDEPQAVLKTRCAIKVYRLRTTKSEYKREYLDGMPVTIEGPVEKQIDSVLKTVDSILKDVSYREGGDIVKLRYPSEALKEILVNAVIHRDYSINDDIHVIIYDNRIEIKSPGRFPGYITADNILEERYSRNPKIVRMLHKLPNPPNHDIGEGLNTAFTAMRKAGLVAPEITESENSVIVKVKHQKLASIEDQILDFLKDHPIVANKDIRDLTGEESENKIKKAFQRLREKGEIEPVNPDASPFQFKYRKARKK